MKTAHLLLLLLLIAPAQAENWPHWRSPHLNSTSGETGLATTWSANENGQANVRWRYDLPGPAASTPIVWDDLIFVTSTEKAGDDLLMLAIGRDGKLRWAARADQGSVEVFGKTSAK